MHVLMCASMYEFWGRNSVKGEKYVKPGKNFIFLKNGKTVISVENQKIFRSQMMKRTSPLNLSCEI